jgi:hypothetical protein
MEFDAFISHSSKDKTMADAICAKLEQAGIRCWIAPRDVAPGKTWSGEIMKAIDRCKVMVLVFSSNANESAQIVRELEAAVHQSKPILPLRIQDILPSNEMAYFMNSVHWLDAITQPLDAHLDQLVQAVSGLLGKPVLSMGETLKDIPIPAPAQVPKPTPSFDDWKPILYIAPVAIALVLFILYLVLDHFGSQVKQAEIISGPLVPTAPASGSVDATMTGTWYLPTHLLGYDGLATLTYSPGGTYQMDTLLSDAGTYQSGAGQFSTTSNGSGTTRQGTYQYAGGHSIKVTGPLGSAFYSPATPQPPLDPTNPVMLGTWTSTVHPPNSPPWNMTVTNNTDGTYTFQIDIADHGTFTSSGGAYTMRSQVTGLTVSGTYQPVDQDTTSFTGPLGAANWSKKKP